MDNQGDGSLNNSREKADVENSDVAEVVKTVENDNPKGYEKFDLSYIQEPFREVFFSWLEYKRVDINFKYKSEKSIKTCYDSLVKLSGGDSQKALLIVEQSVTNGWKGLFELGRNSYGTNSNNGYRSREDIIEGAMRNAALLIAEGRKPKREIGSLAKPCVEKLV